MLHTFLSSLCMGTSIDFFHSLGNWFVLHTSCCISNSQSSLPLHSAHMPLFHPLPHCQLPGSKASHGAASSPLPALLSCGFYTANSASSSYLVSRVCQSVLQGLPTHLLQLLSAHIQYLLKFFISTLQLLLTLL